MKSGFIRWRLTTSLLALALVGAVACGDEGDEPSVIDKITEPECSRICDTFDACVRDIDVETCVDECDAIDDTDSNDALAERCENCLEGRDCVEIDAARCFDDCIRIPEMDRGR